MEHVIADYHTHSTISPDAKSPMEDMCRAAVEKGLSEIVFTDHFECRAPGKAGYLFDLPYLERYFQELSRCQELFDGQLVLKRGIEMGQPNMNQEMEKAVMGAFSFDYVIGSIHKLDNVDLGNMTYTAENIGDICRENLRYLLDMAKNSVFDCMGHVDLIKRYAAKQGFSVDLMDYREELEEILRVLISRGKGMEINTSGLRQEAREALPSLSILKLYRSLGGEILTLGSDAHTTADVAAGLEDAREMALEAGFRHLALYTGHQPSFYSIA
ncbi:MAG: histidinol-phosphatase HisJ family protein [Oscillospiraceae bacterium]|nr:histidinol-phosphatase HisJ family protein [Oscillospiraceae bacterium]